jgi:PRTRC genetic system protein C
VTVTPAVRIFSYSGLNLPDINPKLSPEEIKAAYSTFPPVFENAGKRQILRDKKMRQRHI